MTSYFPISNDQLNESEVTESQSISSDISTSPPSNTSVHETSSTCQPLFRFNDFVKNEVFNTFYEDYVESKHYVNNIMKSVYKLRTFKQASLMKITSKKCKSDRLKRK